MFLCCLPRKRGCNPRAPASPQPTVVVGSSNPQLRQRVAVSEERIATPPLPSTPCACGDVLSSIATTTTTTSIDSSSPTSQPAQQQHWRHFSHCIPGRVSESFEQRSTGIPPELTSTAASVHHCCTNEVANPNSSTTPRHSVGSDHLVKPTAIPFSAAKDVVTKTDNTMDPHYHTATTTSNSTSNSSSKCTTSHSAKQQQQQLLNNCIPVRVSEESSSKVPPEPTSTSSYSSSLVINATHPDEHIPSQPRSASSPPCQPTTMLDPSKQKADIPNGDQTTQGGIQLQSHAQLATPCSRVLKVTSSDGSVAYFHIHDIRGDGDCGFYATGISRKKFTEKLARILLNQEEEEEQNTLTPTQEATVRTLLSESVKAEASRLMHPEMYYVEPRYRAAFERVFPKMTFSDGDSSKVSLCDDAFLVRFVTEVVSFVDGECHPYYATSSDLRLVSLLFGVRIHVYEVLELEFSELTPDNHILCVFDDSEAKGADRDLYLICTGGNHFDKLIPVENDGGMEGAPEQKRRKQ